MPFEREDIIKINGITLYARNDDWGQSGKQSGNKVLLTDETSSQQTDCQLDAVDFHIEAYYLGEDYQNVVSKLYKIYKQQKNMLLEHHDIGRVWVKFANGGYRHHSRTLPVHVRLVAFWRKRRMRRAGNYFLLGNYHS